MRKSKIISFNEKEVTVKELTVAEVVSVIEDMGNYEPHVLDILMDFDIPVSVVLLSTGLEEKDLMEGVSPSGLIPLYEAVVEVNPTLAAMAARLRKVVEKTALSVPPAG
ncbi:hypothetical protein DGMP_06620 [Desulfomarina profundi]|uniref:Uncharacterized protein n=1 Tax=Desulfomarina profundi TaxID=2772557 RepID=A0A8D5FKP8_9BACT|nr:hypothetical protein [Desulfomarina profundi]BCL59969.1 hypothetical protein DGMP_06620 [Desulfomarina profundi]